MNTLIARFARLFAGLDRAHGRFKLSGEITKKGKAEGYAQTLRESVCAEHWRKHLEGVQGLGIVPIRDDETVVFGAIDIDVYDLDLTALEQKIKKLGMPLVLCRTKSAGAHCYLFTAEPIHASIMRNALAVMAMQLGYPGVEIFPKQEALASKEDVGNWINMPYFDAKNGTDRYAIRDGKPLVAEEFVDYADSMRVTDIEYLLKQEFAEQDILKGGPPCLQVIAEQGAPEGIRNETLFNYAIYAKMRHGDKWKQALDEINRTIMDPPLPSNEVVVIIKSIQKKDYFYTCKKQPLCAYCNRDICRQREFGIGDGGNGEDPDIMFDSITQIKTRPPTWVVGINGVRLQMETEELLSQSKFAKLCAENLRYLPAPVKPSIWRKLLNGLFKHAETIEAPDDAGPEGLFWYHLEHFCTSRAEARTRDELLQGKPWHDDNRTYFRAPDLIRYLNQQQFKDFKQHQIFSMLKEKQDVSHHQFNCKGSGVQCWSIPQYAMQTEDFDIPDVESDVDC